jgi:hypothetical protein
VIITDEEFQRLKQMLDEDAGKTHSETGAVTTSLRRILVEHEQLIYPHLMRALGYDPEEYPI